MNIKSLSIREDAITVSYYPSQLSGSLVTIKLTKTSNFNYDEIIDWFAKEFSIKTLKKKFDIFLRGYSISGTKINGIVVGEEVKLTFEFISIDKEQSFVITTAKIKKDELIGLIHKFGAQVKTFVKTYNKQLSLFPVIGAETTFNLELVPVNAE